MYIPCETCFSKYKKEYSKECDTFCDYARMAKENKEYRKSEVLNKQIKHIDTITSRLEVISDDLNRIEVDTLSKYLER